MEPLNDNVEIREVDLRELAKLFRALAARLELMAEGNVRRELAREHLDRLAKLLAD